MIYSSTYLLALYLDGRSCALRTTSTVQLLTITPSPLIAASGKDNISVSSKVPIFVNDVKERLPYMLYRLSFEEDYLTIMIHEDDIVGIMTRELATCILCLALA
ncbi:hypothetical protein BDN70DRAFT_346758 [Pholiota conissans]|uniref:Uncharacterized protein n=1 Tax=Pholiota conissans TaxID=109636 RepID=A0A9P5YU57_9AGAR|nr:hypothetical protein BDN70DRAFT_346758 [Pholiota conissans]